MVRRLLAAALAAVLFVPALLVAPAHAAPRASQNYVVKIVGCKAGASHISVRTEARRMSNGHWRVSSKVTALSRAQGFDLGVRRLTNGSGPGPMRSAVLLAKKPVKAPLAKGKTLTFRSNQVVYKGTKLGIGVRAIGGVTVCRGTGTMQL